MSNIQKALDAIAPYERFKSRGRIAGDDVKLHEFGSTYTPKVVAELEKQLAEAQALLKVKDEALGIAKDYVVNAAAEIHESLAGYLPHKHEAVDEDVLTVKQALAQISGTDALDKMLEEAEQRGYDRWLQNSGKPIECNRVAGVGGVVSTHYAKECLTKGE